MCAPLTGAAASGTHGFVLEVALMPTAGSGHLRQLEQSGGSRAAALEPRREKSMSSAMFGSTRSRQRKVRGPVDAVAARARAGAVASAAR